MTGTPGWIKRTLVASVSPPNVEVRLTELHRAGHRNLWVQVVSEMIGWLNVVEIVRVPPLDLVLTRIDKDGA